MDPLSSQVVSLEGKKYAIPQENLKELVRIPAAEVKNKIDKVGAIPVVRLRQTFLPLLDFADALGVQKTYQTVTGERQNTRRTQIADRRSVQHLDQGASFDLKTEDDLIDRQKDDRRISASSAINIAIVTSEDYNYGLVVDRFHDSEQIEIRPAGRYLEPCGVYSGTTILKNQQAALVLDIFNIAHKAGLSNAAKAVNDAVSEISNQDPGSGHYSLLTFRNSDTEYFAVDLDCVERLERIKSADFEKIGSKEVVQYRGAALVVVELSQVLKCSAFQDSEYQEVIVFRQKDTLVGVKVFPPVDTVECRLSLDKSTFNTPPILGSAILNDNTTLLLDVPAMVKTIQGIS